MPANSPIDSSINIVYVGFLICGYGFKMRASVTADFTCLVSVTSFVLVIFTVQCSAYGVILTA